MILKQTRGKADADLFSVSFFFRHIQQTYSKHIQNIDIFSQISKTELFFETI